MSGEPTILTTKEKIMKKTDKIITNNLNDQIAQLFSTLKMPAANQTFQNQQKSPDYVDMPFSVRLHHILRAEVTAREEKRKSRLYKESGINDALPSLDRLTYDKSRGLKRELIDELSTGEYLKQRTERHRHRNGRNRENVAD